MGWKCRAVNQKLVNLYKQKLIEHNKNMAESEKKLHWHLPCMTINYQLQIHFITMRREMPTEFWWGHLKGKRPLGRPGCR